MPRPPTHDSSRRTKLLVSVRNAEEARTALEAGADIIDVKEPSRGPLGRADDEVIRSVIAAENVAVDAAAPLSAALGELIDWRAGSANLPPGLAYVKFGLAGCAADPQWRHRWQEAVASLPEDVSPVAVVYADYESAAAPPPQEVLRLAQETSCRTLLIDTFNKRQRNLLDQWPKPALHDFAAAVRRAGIELVLAGSLDQPAIGHVLDLRPYAIAIRGAACDNGREGRVSRRRIRELLETLAVGRGPRRTR